MKSRTIVRVLSLFVASTFFLFYTYGYLSERGGGEAEAAGAASGVGRSTEVRLLSTIDDLYEQFSKADAASDGGVTKLIEAIDTEDALEIEGIIRRSGLLDVDRLMSGISLAESLERDLRAEEEDEYVAALFSQLPRRRRNKNKERKRPFWGIGLDEDCEELPDDPLGEMHGKVGDGKCYKRMKCKKYRFWIFWGGYKNKILPVECP